MTLTTPTGATGSRPSVVASPVSVEHELEALRAAMEIARHEPASFDDIEDEFETFLAAVTHFPASRYSFGPPSTASIPAPPPPVWPELERAS